MNKKIHQPCPDCGSSDAMVINEDGSTKCYSCDKFKPSTKNDKVANKDLKPNAGKFRDIPDRKLTKDTCIKFGVKTIMGEKDIEQHIYPYTDNNGNLVAQKIRTVEGKKFHCRGRMQDTQLFGQSVFPANGKYITITEGELDAMSVYQMQGSKYPVVSLPSASAARKAIKDNYEYLDKFDNIVLCIDNDEAGQKAVKIIASILNQKKLKIVKLSKDLKDASGYLVNNKADEFCNLWWRAEEYKPEDIINFDDMWERVSNFMKYDTYIETGWSGLDAKIVGIRPSQLVVIASGTGMGKSLVLKTLMHNLLKKTDLKIGAFFLEEVSEDTVRSLMSIEAGKNLKKPVVWQEQTEEDLQRWFKDAGAEGRIDLYDGFDFDDIDLLIDKIRYLINARDCKVIILDHLTMVVDGAEDSRKELNRLTNRLKSLAVSEDAIILAACHLRKSTNSKTHEEGGRVTLDDLKDSSSVKQLSDTIIGLERNQQSSDPTEANRTAIRVLKNRDFGDVGIACGLQYDKETTRFTVCDIEDITDPF